MDERFLLSSQEIEIAAAEAGKLPRVSILAYSGHLMSVPGFGPVVVDLQGMECTESIPLLVDHENTIGAIVGQGMPTIRTGQLFVEGHANTATPAAVQVVALAKQGHQFQASIGATPLESRRLNAGETVSVNQRRITAPAGGCVLITKSKLREVTICALGCDSATSVSIAAKLKEKNMTSANTDDILTAERQRVSEIEALFDGLDLISGDGGPYDNIRKRADGLRAQAMSGSLTMTEVHAKLLKLQRDDIALARIRAERPQLGSMTRSSRLDGNGKPNAVLEAAFLAHLGQESVGEKLLGADVMQRGRDLRCTHIMDLVKASFHLAGMDAPHNANEMLRAAFSTMSLPGVLGNAAGKLLLNSYNAYPSVFRMIAAKLSANDFKQKTGYRMTAATTFEKVGPAGELKHGTFTESDYPYNVDTYGKMFGITRQDIINDDLGAFTTMPQQIGRGAAEAIEDLAWTIVLANAGSFFGVGNGNYISGAGTVLQPSSLASAVEKMLKQTNELGKPISVFPKFLVVPPELKATADELYVSRTHNTGGASTSDRVPNANPFFGLYEPLTTPYLSNSAYSGYSTTAWYLFGDPVDVAAFGIAYLNGLENPTVETSEAEFSTLGIQFRGFLDFGICAIDPRGAVKSAGA